MNKLDSMPIQPCDEVPKLDILPRVFFRKSDEDYEEILGIKSFERKDDNLSGRTISLVIDEVMDDTARNLLHDSADKYVDVKMEFMFGMLMVMSFSGFVEQVSSDMIVFSVSTPITTDVQDVAQ